MSSYKDMVWDTISFNRKYLDKDFRFIFDRDYVNYRIGDKVNIFINSPVRDSIQRIYSYCLHSINPKRTGFNLVFGKKLEVTSRILEEL
jgi:hypothetical protein